MVPRIILFDGYCGLCNAWVDFVLSHDRRKVYRFAPLQSPRGQELLQKNGLPPDFVDSFVLVADGETFFRSSAFLQALRGLGFPYSLSAVAAIIPSFIRDRIYDFVAEHRFTWFGRRNTCRLPTPDEAARFLQ